MPKSRVCKSAQQYLKHQGKTLLAQTILRTLLTKPLCIYMHIINESFLEAKKQNRRYCENMCGIAKMKPLNETIAHQDSNKHAETVT